MKKEKIPLYKICALTVVHYMASAIIRNFIPLHTEALGAAPHITGIVVASFAFLPLFVTIPGGSIVDAVGSKKVVIFAGALMMVSSVMLIVLPMVVFVGISQVLIGLAHVSVAVSTQAYVSKLDRGKNKTSNFGFYSFAIAFGFMAGPLLGGVLADMWGFAATFAGAGVLSAGTVFLASILPRPNGEDELKNDGTENQIAEFQTLVPEGRELLKNTPVRLSIFISMCALFAFAIRTSFYPVYLGGIGFTRSSIGILISIQSGVALVLRPHLGKLFRWAGFMPILISALLIGAVGVGITPYLVSFAPLALAAVVAGVTTALSQPISMILMAEGSPEDSRGLAMSLRLTGNRVVMLLGPATLGLVASWMGVRFTFLFSTAVLLLGIGILILWRMGSASEIEIKSQG